MNFNYYKFKKSIPISNLPMHTLWCVGNILLYFNLVLSALYNTQLKNSHTLKVKVI